MNIKYWIGLSSVEQIDSSFVRILYEYFGDIERVFNCSEKDLQNIEGLNIKKAEEFLYLRDKINIDKTYDEVEKRGINILTFDDSHYPRMLEKFIIRLLCFITKGICFPVIWIEL